MRYGRLLLCAAGAALHGSLARCFRTWADHTASLAASLAARRPALR